MYRNLFLLLIALFLGACSQKSIVAYPDYKEHQGDALNARVLEAFNYEHFGEFVLARDAYLSLFKDYNSTFFLENAFLLTLINNLDKANEINTLAKPHLSKSDNLKRLSVLYALQNFDLKTAEKLSLELINLKDNDPRNFELYGDVLARKNIFKKANHYYRLAYEQVKSEELLFKIISSYAILNDTNNIKFLLEDFRKLHGCTMKSCLLLAKIYTDENNDKALQEIYISLYELSKNQEFIVALVRTLDSQNKKQNALDLALKYKLHPDITIYLYQSLKDYENAVKLSLETYQKNGNKDYLLRAAVLEFEGATAKKSIDAKLLQSVSKKFEEGIAENSDALYLNYYGYLLIDYDLDIKKGMQLVELALGQDPENLYYIDSLAWGYYKLGDCNKAYELMQKTFYDKEFSSSQESKEHIKAIKACLK